MKKFLLYIFIIAFCLTIPSFARAADQPDADGDGLPDSVEIALGTNPNHADSDGDNFHDGIEVYNGYNPLVGGKDRSIERSAVVNLSKQELSFFMNGVKINSFPVSTGVWRTPTPTGTFEILRKLPVVRYLGENYDYPNTKWNLEFKRRYYLHGAYWHNQFGIRPMSHGCVNIAYANAKVLYDFLDVGDEVRVTGTLPSRPLVRK